MKKALLIPVALICLSLTACNSTPGDSVSNNVSESSFQSSETYSSNSASSKSSSSASYSVPETKSEEFKTTGKISQTVLYDQNNVKITATDLVYNNYNAELKLNIENNTETDLSFRSATMAYSCNSVNGYMVDIGYLNCEVAAGKKANDTVKFSYDVLGRYGINEIADVEIGFNIDAADIFDDKFEEIYTGSCVLETTSKTFYDYSKSTFRNGVNGADFLEEYGRSVKLLSDEILYENSGVSVISEVIVTNDDGDTTLFLEVENGTSDQLEFRTRDISLNGLKLYGPNYSYDLLNPGKKRVVEISFANMIDARYLGVCDLNEIGSAGVKFDVKKYDSETEICSGELDVKVNGTDGKFSESGTEVYNKNRVRIISKGLFGEEYDTDSNYYLILLVENASNKALKISDKFDSLSVNGYMTEYYFGSAELEPNETQFVKIRLSKDSLIANNINELGDITDVEFAVRVIENSYKEIDNGTVKITF